MIMEIEQVMEYLPHRYPFLLIDRVTELELGKTITAIKNVTINEPFFPGHFPGAPVMPGVLIGPGPAERGGRRASFGRDGERASGHPLGTEGGGDAWARRTGQDRPVELIDGVKIHHDEGWVLALPDPEEPLTHLIAEAADERTARRLLDEYVRRIGQMQG